MAPTCNDDEHLVELDGELWVERIEVDGEELPLPGRFRTDAGDESPRDGYEARLNIQGTSVPNAFEELRCSESRGEVVIEGRRFAADIAVTRVSKRPGQTTIEFRFRNLERAD